MRSAVWATFLLAATFLAACAAHPGPGWKGACPQADFLMPCRCIEAQIGLRVLCSGISSRRHLQAPFDYLRVYDLNTLTLQHVDFPITVDLFKGLNVVIIKILDSTFKVLDPPAKPGADTNLVLGNKLEGLDVRQTTLDLGNTNLGAMKSLKHVMVDASTINVLRKNWFHGLTRVRSFVIEHTSITRVEDEALSGLDSVEEIKLAANELSAVQRNYFPHVASKLSHLDLSDNRLTSLPPDMFDNMPVLASVTLTHNKFKTLPPTPWRPMLRQLTHVTLDDNPIVCNANISWLLESDTRHKVSGACEEPPNMHGVRLEDLDASRLPR